MRRFLPALALAALTAVAPAAAQETVSVGGSNVILLKPSGMPRGSVILMPGGDGRIRAGPDGQPGNMRLNQLVRTRENYRALGLAVMVVDSGTNLAAAVRYMAEIKRPVTVVATSRGTQRAARGIAAGAKPDALVLTSGFLSGASGAGIHVMNILRSPAALPRTLVIHHRQDSCRYTLPAGVDPFIKWAGGKARVAWLEGGRNRGDPCDAFGHHGFAGLDAAVVSLAAGFR